MAYTINTITSCGLHHQHYHILWPTSSTSSTLSHLVAYIINTITSRGLHHQHYHILRPTSTSSTLSHPAAYTINTITSCGLHHQHYHILWPTSSTLSHPAAYIITIINSSSNTRCNQKYTVCTEKQSQRIFSITSLGLMKCYKTWRTFSLSLLRTQLQWYFQRKLCNTLPQAFYFNDVLQNWNRNY